MSDAPIPDWLKSKTRQAPAVKREAEEDWGEDEVVRRAEAKFNELLARRTNQLRVENV